MARGKEAAAAANRKYEAAIAHLDRITNELLDAKDRARRYESAFVRLPVMEAEVRSLRAQLEDGCSERVAELEALTEDFRDRMFAQEEERQRMRKHFQRAMEKLLPHLEKFEGDNSMEQMLALVEEKPKLVISDDEERIMSRNGGKFSESGRAAVIRYRELRGNRRPSNLIVKDREVVG